MLVIKMCFLDCFFYFFLGSEFKIYLPQLIPQILQVLMHDNHPDKKVTGKLLIAIQRFGNTLADYLHLFLPPIVKLFDSPEVPIGKSICSAKFHHKMAWAVA